MAANVDAEQWRSFYKGNGKYEVSNLGNVRNIQTKQILHQYTSIHGYKILTIYPEKHKKTNIIVHQIVAEAFLGNKSADYVVNHIDGNKTNNCIDNLEYVTSSENNIHALKTGLRHIADMNKVIKRGEDHYRSSITEQDVIDILRYRKATHEGCRKIAKVFNVSKGTVDGILLNKTWKHVDRNSI